MSNLPQIHDWMVGLLTTNQWIFVWVVLGFIIVCTGIYAAVTLPDEGVPFLPLSIFVAVIVVPLLGAMIWVLGNVLSWLIYLLNT